MNNTNVYPAVITVVSKRRWLREPLSGDFNADASSDPARVFSDDGDEAARPSTPDVW